MQEKPKQRMIMTIPFYDLPAKFQERFSNYPRTSWKIIEGEIDTEGIMLIKVELEER